MSVWGEDEISRLRRRYVGDEADFEKLAGYLAAVWTAADLQKLERDDLFVLWDAYFRREKLIAGKLKSD